MQDQLKRLDILVLEQILKRIVVASYSFGKIKTNARLCVIGLLKQLIYPVLVGFIKFKLALKEK